MPSQKSKGRRRQASPRILLVAGVVAVALAIGFAFALRGGGSGSGLPTNAASVGSLAIGLPGSDQVDAQYRGIPQHGMTLGSPFAPVTMTVYLDLQCVVCKDFETTVFPDVVRTFVRTGKVKVVVQPWAFISKDSFRGQSVMLAAGKQNKAFNFASILFANQGAEQSGWLTDDMLYQIAVSIPGMRIKPLFGERDSAWARKSADRIDADARANGVHGTPTLFIGRSGTKPRLFAAGMPDKTQLFAALNAAAA